MGRQPPRVFNSNYLFTSDAIRNKFKFIQQINMSYGSGGMLCSFEHNQLVEFFHFLKRNTQGNLPIKKAVFYPSQHLESHDQRIWILSPDMQISQNGCQIDDLYGSQFIWLPKEALGQESDLSTLQGNIACNIIKPLSSNVLVKYFEIMRACLQHNFEAGVVISEMLMMFHYTIVREIFGGCSIPVAVGPAETGKSTAIKLGLALFGLEESSHYVRGTNALFLSRSSACIVPYAIDDPKGKGKAKTKQLDIGELIVDIYNGSASANMQTGQLKPITGPIIATNFPLGDSSRWVLIYICYYCLCMCTCKFIHYD